jgi:predicted metalloprotease
MKWKNRRRSHNVEDNRSRGIGRKAGGGGIGVIILALVAMYFGVDPNIVLNMGETISQTNSSQSQQSYQPSASENQLAQFVSVVLADTEDVWNALFKAQGKRYQEPRLVLFTQSVQSACGMAGSASGPFYCPADKKVYIDLSFYEELKSRHNAPGDFAQAYVIAHEVGHHVQNLLGISTKVHQAKQQLSKEKGNKLSVKLELQADCLAGVWAYHTEQSKHILDAGDLQEALVAASAIGDDRLQKQSRGYVTPESFTHGSSKQRMYWFKQGFNNGKMNLCNTFERL